MGLAPPLNVQIFCNINVHWLSRTRFTGSHTPDVYCLSNRNSLLPHAGICTRLSFCINTVSVSKRSFTLFRIVYLKFFFFLILHSTNSDGGIISYFLSRSVLDPWTQDHVVDNSSSPSSCLLTLLGRSTMGSLNI